MYPTCAIIDCSWIKTDIKYILTLRFFFKFVSQAYCSKIHRPNESPRKQKMLPWKSFWNKITLKPLDFWAGEALEAWMQGCLNITSAQTWHAVIFQISAEKNFKAWQKSFQHFCIILGVVICKNHVAKPLDSFNKCRKFLFLSRETFFCRNLKNYSMSFLGWCNVEITSHPGI